MINVSRQFIDDVNNDNRKYVPIITITLADGTVLSPTENQIMAGGLTIDESVSNAASLDMGSVTINKATIVLNNIDDDFTPYDFAGAVVNVRISLALTTGTTETFQRGKYVVDEQMFDGSLVTLTCLDYLSKFDKPYTDSMLTYPATLLEILQDACTVCGVTLASTSFLNSDLQVATRPTDTGLTFRTLIGYVAQIACSNAYANENGELELRWYDMLALSVNVGERITEEGAYRVSEDGIQRTSELDDDDLDGYANLAVLRALYTINTAVDQTVITGVRVVVRGSSSDNVLDEYYSGVEGNYISIENNVLVTATNAQAIASSIGAIVIGMEYRKANWTHLSTPYLQAGDVALIFDGKGNTYHVLVSSTIFTILDRQNSTSAGATPARNKAAEYKRRTATYIDSGIKTALEAKEEAATAQETAEDAKKVASNYLSSDTSGIMVADLADGTQTPSTATGRNVKVDSNGVYIRDGQTVKASFGDTVVIGEDNELNMEISSNKMDLDLMEGNKFSVGWQLGQSDNRSFQGNISKSVTSLPLTISMSEFSDIEGDVYPFSAINGWFHISYTKNGEEYAYYSREGSESFTCTENTFTILDTEEAQEMIGGTITNVLLTYTTLEYPLAFLNFGERLANTSIGMFSAIMGKGLTATADNSLALGEYNFDLGWSQEDMIPIFSIGNVTDEDHQSNLFAVGEGQMYFADPRWDSTELEMINAPAFVVNGVGETYLRADAEYAGDSELRTAIYNLGLEESLIHSVGIEAAIIDMIEIKGMFAKILDMFVPKSITDISTLVTAASGVSIGICRMAICGKIATLYLRATPSAAKSGTWQIGTLNTGYRPFEEVGFLTGTAASIGYIGTGGNITYAGSVSANANCYVKATFILA